MTSITPDEIDLGARRVPGWYWFESGVQRRPFEPTPGTGSVRHCFSYERSPSSIKEEALRLIAGAERKIFLASFRFVDDDLRAALSKAADRLRGGVYVITSIASRDLRQTVDFKAVYEEDEEEDWLSFDSVGADPNAEENKKHYAELIRSGVWVRGHPEFHAKFLVVDDRAALVSSANLEAAALADAVDRPGRRRGFDAVTGESGVVTTRAEDARLLGRFFARLWHAECIWDAPPGVGYQLRQRTASPSPCEVPVPDVGRVGPIWTGSGEQLILQTLHDIIGLAEKELVLATFSVKELDSHPDMLYEPVRAAVARGVRIRLLVRSRNFLATRSALGLMAGWGVAVHGDDKTHAKCAIADGRAGALFSANFDAEHGIYRGVEMGMRLDGETALAEALRFFEHCLDHAPQRLHGDPTAREAADSLYAPQLQRWDPDAVFEVTADDRTWASLTRTRSPALLARVSDDDWQLHIGDGTWQLLSRGGVWRLQTRTAPRQPDRVQADLLESWLDNRRTSLERNKADEELRGVLATRLIRQGG
ncbi:phospholipase D-like domain-containing protein [Catenulispora subtropica]|uniref:phospholipase D n=1 Tax=Catenulispora subtropica TaxID=450798 RepID=A0ABP5C552_9ACTN